MSSVKASITIVSLLADAENILFPDMLRTERELVISKVCSLDKTLPKRLISLSYDKDFKLGKRNFHPFSYVIHLKTIFTNFKDN